MSSGNPTDLGEIHVTAAAKSHEEIGSEVLRRIGRAEYGVA